MVTEQPKVGEFIRKGDGNPYTDMKAAATQQTILSRQGIITKPISWEGGGVVLEVLQVRGPSRTPLGMRNRLVAPKLIPGYEQRFFNDIDSRLDDALDAGWEPVENTSGRVGDEYVGNSRIPGNVVAKPVGKGKIAVLMKKRSDWFTEDYAKRHEIDQQNEDGLVAQAQVDGLRPAVGYQQGIKISDRPRDY